MAKNFCPLEDDLCAFHKQSVGMQEEGMKRIYEQGKTVLGGF